MNDVPIRKQITAVNEAIRDIDHELVRVADPCDLRTELEERRHALKCATHTLSSIARATDLLDILEELLTAAAIQEQATEEN